MTTKSIAEALGALNKGRAAPAVGNYASIPVGHGVIPTGIISLDRHMRGGLPRGRFTHLYGMKSVGKSTLAILSVRNALKVEPDRAVLYLDTENALDFDYMRALGVDPDDERFIYSAPDDGEDAILIAQKLMATGDLSLLVLDSVTGVISEARLQNDPGKGMPAVTARMMSEFCQRLARSQSKHNTATLLLNHLGGTMKTDFHGNEIRKPRGGEAIPNWAAVELLLKRAAKPIKEGDVAVASETTIVIEKSKIGLPFREVTLPMVFGQGFDVLADAGEAAISSGLATTAGAFITLGDRKFQGRAKFFEALGSNPENIERIRAAVIDGVAFEWPS